MMHVTSTHILTLGDTAAAKIRKHVESCAQTARKSEKLRTNSEEKAA
jgi:hypothetical protein